MSDPSPSKIRRFFSHLNLVVSYVVCVVGVLALVGLICAVFLGWFLGSAVVPFQRAWEAGAWQETPCTITRSWVEKDEDRERPYSPRVEYTYSYGGHEYQGNRLSLHQGKRLSFEPEWHEHSRRCHRVIGRYPVGSERVCYVNPAQPSESVLRRRYGWGSIVFGLLSPTLMLFCLHEIRRSVHKDREQTGAQGRAELRGQRIITFRAITTGAVIFAALALITAIFVDDAGPLAVCLGVFAATVPWYLFIALRSLLGPRLGAKVFSLTGCIVWGVCWALWLFPRFRGRADTPLTALGTILLYFLAVSLMVLLLHRVFRRLALRDPSPVDTEGRVTLCSRRSNAFLTIFATLFVGLNLLGPMMAIFLFFYPNSPNLGGLGLLVLIAIAPLYVFVASRGPHASSGLRLIVKAFPVPMSAGEECGTQQPRRRFVPFSVRAGEDFEVEWRFRAKTPRLRKLTITLEGTMEERGHRARFRTINIFETEDPLAVAEGKALCAVPADVRPSGEDGDTKVTWNLCFRGPIPTRPDLREEFGVRIAPGADSGQPRPV